MNQVSVWLDSVRLHNSLGSIFVSYMRKKADAHDITSQFANSSYEIYAHKQDYNLFDGDHDQANNNIRENKEGQYP